MLIIIEGVDRTGKTSLAESLKNRINHSDLRHCSAPPPLGNAIDEYVDPLCGYFPGSACQSVVYDRHYLGESVWPEIFGRQTVMTEADRAAIEGFLLSRGALLVLAQRDEESLRQAVDRGHEQGEQPINGEQAVAAQRRFVGSALKSPLPRFHYVHGEVPPETIVRTAVEVERWAATMHDMRRIG